MLPRERRSTGQDDLFRSRLDQIVDTKHPLAKPAHHVDWAFLEKTFGAAHEDGPGQPLLPTRLMAGLAILKHTYNLSDEAVCERWVENPYYHAHSVREQRQKQRGKKIYSLNAPEVECIGKGKAHWPYEFSVKVSLGTTLHRSAGGQFVVHVRAMPGNPYDGHTLASVIPDIERKIGASIQRIVADRGYRGHNAAPDHKFNVFVTEPRRGMTKAIKREMRRRAAVESVIVHTTADHRMDRNFLKGSNGDAINAALAAAG
jgi:transposase, IS5 family